MWPVPIVLCEKIEPSGGGKQELVGDRSIVQVIHNAPTRGGHVTHHIDHQDKSFVIRFHLPRCWFKARIISFTGDDNRENQVWKLA